MSKSLEEAFLEFVRQEYGEVTYSEVKQYGAGDKRICDEENAFEKGVKEVLRVCEEWCGMDAYEHDYDKPTDEHSCDNSRGRQCSADELLNKLKSWAGEK